MKKERIIKNIPKITRFSPRGQRGRPDAIVLEIEELEAIRLADMQGLKHIECASCMGISRQTFERMLKKARKKIALALIEGKIININR